MSSVTLELFVTLDDTSNSARRRRQTGGVAGGALKKWV